jgi:hypothetical protein
MEQEPQLLRVADGHNVRCWLYEEDSDHG